MKRSDLVRRFVKPTSMSFRDLIDNFCVLPSITPSMRLRKSLEFVSPVRTQGQLAHPSCILSRTVTTKSAPTFSMAQRKQKKQTKRWLNCADGLFCNRLRSSRKTGFENGSMTFLRALAFTLQKKISLTGVGTRTALGKAQKQIHRSVCSPPIADRCQAGPRLGHSRR
jgi:hypothetical protein